MGKKDTHVHVGPVFLVMEIQLDKDRSPECLAAIFSLVGRESVLALHYPLQSGRIDARVLEDLMAGVGRQIAQAVETGLGIQGVLPMV